MIEVTKVTETEDSAGVAEELTEVGMDIEIG